MIAEYLSDADYLPVLGDRCFCCESSLNPIVRVLADGVFICRVCDQELHRRRRVYLATEGALDAGNAS